MDWIQPIIVAAIPTTIGLIAVFMQVRKDRQRDIGQQVLDFCELMLERNQHLEQRVLRLEEQVRNLGETPVNGKS